MKGTPLPFGHALGENTGSDESDLSDGSMTEVTADVITPFSEADMDADSYMRAHGTQLPVNYLSATCQLPVSYLSAACQLPVSYLSAACQLPVSCLSATCQLPVSYRYYAVRTREDNSHTNCTNCLQLLSNV